MVLVTCFKALREAIIYLWCGGGVTGYLECNNFYKGLMGVECMIRRYVVAPELGKRSLWTNIVENHVVFGRELRRDTPLEDVDNSCSYVAKDARLTIYASDIAVIESEHEDRLEGAKSLRIH